MDEVIRYQSKETIIVSVLVKYIRNYCASDDPHRELTFIANGHVQVDCGVEVLLSVEVFLHISKCRKGLE